MKIAFLSRNPLGWGTRALKKEFDNMGHSTTIIPTRALVASIGPITRIFGKEQDLSKDFDSVVLRVLGNSSLEEILHIMEVCRYLEIFGQVLVNSAKATSNCLNKFTMLNHLLTSGIRVPLTYVVRRVEDGVKIVEQMGEAVLKPIFGSRGMNVVFVSNIEMARFVLEEMILRGQVPLIQEFIRHEGFDIRALVVGGRVVAAMKRESNKFRTNISRGGKPIPMEIEGELSEIALVASRALGCDFAGVDLVMTNKGIYVLEVNSQPDFRALQSVSDKNISLEIATMVIDKARR